jgi:phosphotriesterase-related protein
MNRTALLLLSGIFAITGCVPSPSSVEAIEPPFVQTVSGRISPDSMGLTLIHEHVFLDWTSADSIQPQQWNVEEAFSIILPYLKEARQMGVETILECTPAYLGRSPRLLKRLADSSGLMILTNTGWYGARNYQHLPQQAYEEGPDELAARWQKEYHAGIDGTGIKPGFIKIGINSDTVLAPLDEKLVRAAARTHLQTGLTIVAHTGPEAGAFAELQILEEEGVAPEAFVWTHAQNGSMNAHTTLAKKGVWISLDGMGWIDPESDDGAGLKKYVQQLVNLRENGMLQRTLIAHDAGWYTHGEANGGSYQPYTAIFSIVIPALRKEGFTERDIRQMLIENPQEAYAIRVRALK